MSGFGKNGTLVGTEIYVGGVHSLNNVYVEDELDVGGDATVEGDFIVKGNAYTINENGEKVKLGAGGDVSLKGVEDDYSEFTTAVVGTAPNTKSIIPSDITEADIEMDETETSCTNKIKYDGNGTTEKGTFFAHQIRSAGVVVSDTGFVAQGKDGNNDIQSFMLPNVISTDAIHCKRIYAKDRDTSDDTTNEVEVIAKKLKLDECEASSISVAEINVGIQNKTSKLTSLVDNELGGTVEIKPATYMEIIPPDGNKTEQTVDASLTGTKRPALVVHGPIQCTNLIGNTESSAASLTTLTTNTIEAGTSGKVKFVSPLDGYPEIYEGYYNYIFGNDYYPYVYYENNVITLENKILLQQNLTDFLPEYSLFHGAYVLDPAVFAVANLLMTPITNISSTYFDSTNTNVILGKICEISKDISLTEEFRNDSVLFTKFFSFLKTFIGTGQSSYYVYEIKDNEDDYTINLKNIPIYETYDNEVGDVCSSYIVVNKKNLSCDYKYKVERKSGSPKTPIDKSYTVKPTKIETFSEYVFQFLFFNFTALSSMITLSLGPTEVVNPFIGKFIGNPEYIQENKNNVVISPGKMAGLIHWINDNKTDKVFWEALKYYLSKKSDFASINNSDIRNIYSGSHIKLFKTLSTYKSPYGKINIFSRNGNIKLKWYKEESNNPVEYTIETTSSIHDVVGIKEIDGDVSMNGNLSVNTITSENGAVSIPYLDVGTIYKNGVSYELGASEADSVLGFKTYTAALYASRSSWIDPIDKSVDVNGTGCPNIYMDINYIGKIAFIGVRSFVIPGNIADSYYPNSYSPHGKGAFKLLGDYDFIINPYCYPILEADNPVMTTKTGTIMTRKMNPRNAYSLASSKIKLYYVTESEYSAGGELEPTCECTYDIHFIVYENNLNYILLYFPKLTKNDYPSLTISGKKLLYMYVDGFRITGVCANKKEDEAGLYTMGYYSAEKKSYTFIKGVIQYNEDMKNSFKQKEMYYCKVENTYICKTSESSTDIFDINDIYYGDNCESLPELSLYSDLMLITIDSLVIYTVPPARNAIELKFVIYNSGNNVNLVNDTGGILNYDNKNDYYIFVTTSETKLYKTFDSLKNSVFTPDKIKGYFKSGSSITAGTYEIYILKSGKTAYTGASDVFKTTTITVT